MAENRDNAAASGNPDAEFRAERMERSAGGSENNPQMQGQSASVPGNVNDGGGGIMRSDQQAGGAGPLGGSPGRGDTPDATAARRAYGTPAPSSHDAPSLDQGDRAHSSSTRNDVVGGTNVDPSQVSSGYRTQVGGGANPSHQAAWRNQGIEGDEQPADTTTSAADADAPHGPHLRNQLAYGGAGEDGPIPH